MKNAALEKYLREMESALRRGWDIDGRYNRPEHTAEANARRCAQDLGSGLADFDEEAVRPYLNELYGRFLVKSTFGRIGGVPIDAADFLGHVRATAAYERAAAAVRQAAKEEGGDIAAAEAISDWRRENPRPSLDKKGQAVFKN